MKRNKLLFASIRLIICFLSLLTLSVAMTGCTRYTPDPPSPYIGIYESYNGEKNGKLPVEDENALYSGKWASQDHSLTGRYEAGIPTGLWKSYYPNSALHTSIAYYDNGNFLEVSLYPDGMPQSTRTGKYRFADGKYTLSDVTGKYWGLTGNAVADSAAAESRVFQIPRAVPDWVQGISSSLQNLSVECFYTAEDNHFILAVYLIPREKLRPAECCLVKGSVDLISRKLNIRESTTSGDINLKLERYSIAGNRLKLIFASDRQPAPLNRIEVELWLKSNPDAGI